MPNVHRKGVGMRVGLDIASLTLKRQVDVIVRVTGDSDFTGNGIRAARGAQLFLANLGHKVVDEMHEHADVIVDIEYVPAV